MDYDEDYEDFGDCELCGDPLLDDFSILCDACAWDMDCPEDDDTEDPWTYWDERAHQ